MRRTRTPEWAYEIARALKSIDQKLVDLDRKVDEMADQQAEIDADVQQIQADTSAIKAEINSLQNQHPNLDLSALRAAVGDLDTVAAPPVTPTP